MAFEDAVSVPARWQYFAALGQGSLEGCIYSESVSIVWFLQQPGFMGPGIKEWKWEWHHSLLP